MAKTTKKTGAGRIPKRIAGVKIPKPLRKSAEALITEVEKPETRAMLASGAAMLVGAVIAAQAKRGAPAAAPAAATSNEGGAPPPASEGDRLVDAFSALARSALDGVFAKKG